MADSTVQLNIAICDDEPETLRMLCDRVTAILGGNVTLFAATEPQTLLNAEAPFHIALLDVQLLESTGIELARQILERNSICRIIFVSGFLHAISAVYEVPHFCFILKEQLEEHLPEFLRRAADLAAQEAGQALTLLCGRNVQTVPLRDIAFLERRGHITRVNLTDGTQLQVREKLADLHSRIPSPDFIRCHISYLVNLAQVRQAEPHSFLMNSGACIPISRPNEKESREAFFRHLTQ